jgi:uncharacterized damage-inducible protein DinB
MELQEFLRYTQKADEMIFKALADANFAIPEANTLLSHILCAQHIWAKRILNEKPTYAVWEQFEPGSFDTIYRENIQLLEVAFASKQASEVVNYSNSAGDVFSNTVEEILMHVCNHGTYHRGQLAKMLKQAGFTPPLTDYIMLKRQNII